MGRYDPYYSRYGRVDISKEDFMGRSFLPILDGEITKGWDKMYASHTFHEITMYYPMRAMRKGDYKIIWNIAYQLEYPFASDLWVSSTWQSVLRNNKNISGNVPPRLIFTGPNLNFTI